MTNAFNVGNEGKKAMTDMSKLQNPFIEQRREPHEPDLAALEAEILAPPPQPDLTAAQIFPILKMLAGYAEEFTEPTTNRGEVK